MVLKECPNYEDCIRIHRDLNIRVPHGEFSCYGCNCYKCYELGFVQGVKEAVKKINELPKSILQPMCATDLERDSEEYYNNCLRKLKGE